jgi:hypothetical protein
MKFFELGRVRKMLLAAMLSIGLLGCHDDIPPAVSGNVVDGGLFLGQLIANRPGYQADEWELKKTQIEQLNLWLQSHHGDWERILASPPPPSLSVMLTHSDGTHSRVDLFDINESWKNVLVVHAASAENNGMRHLTAQEREELLAIVKKTL